MRFFSFSLFFYATLLSFHSAHATAIEFDISKIFGITYFASYEENTADGVVPFRPAGYDFPAPLARPGFKFDENGQYTMYQPLPFGDEVIAVPGVFTWQQEDLEYWIYQGKRLVSRFTLAGTPDKVIRTVIPVDG